MTTKTHNPNPPPPKPLPVTANLKDTDQDVKNSVPKKYHNYMDVFSPTKVKHLPDHQLHDININLEEEKTPPFGAICSLSQDKCKALFKYIKNNLSKGFIHCSTSSSAFPILLIKQKTGDLHLCIDY